MEAIKEYKVKNFDIDVFDLKPHQHPKSRELFSKAIVDEDMQTVKEMIDDDPTLAFQIDDRR